MRFAPWWGWLLVLAVVLPALARAGRPEDRPIISPATTVPRFRVLNADVVLRAYYAAGLGHPDKPGQQVEFESAMTRDGEGSRVKVILPYGAGFDAAVKAKDDLASGLDVAPSQVYLTRDKTSHRRHTLWVADRDPLAIPAGRTPLLDGKRRSIWQPAPFGLDERGRKVTLLLLWISILVGAQPRKGKTFSGRLLALYAALDPSVRLSVVDGKNSPDWNAFRKIAYHFIHGIVPSRDGDPVAQLIAALTEIKQPHPGHQRLPGLAAGGRVPRRQAHRGTVPPGTPGGCSCGCWSWRNSRTTSSCPTRSSTRRSPTCCRSSWRSAPPPACSSSRCRRSRPGSARVTCSGCSTGTGTTTRCGSRSSAATGWSPTPSWAGTPTPRGSTPPRCRSAGNTSASATCTARPTTPRPCGPTWPTPKTPSKIVTAARVLRERAGTLAGFAAGEDTGTPARDVLADLLAVLGSEAGQHWPVLADRLAVQFPGRWADATAEAVSAQCRDLGVPSVDVKVSGVVRKGCRRAEVRKAASA